MADRHQHVRDWSSTRQRFIAWWGRHPGAGPLIRCVARRTTGFPDEPAAADSPAIRDRYLDVEYLTTEYRRFCRGHLFLGDSYPSLSVDLGAGSLALYLGSQPVFAEDTVWFSECVTGTWEEWGDLRYDGENRWWVLHQKLIRRAGELAGDEYLVNIPDLVENVDILAALRGPQRFCYDLVDEPELMERYVGQVDDLYFRYYDRMYDLVRSLDGSSSYTAFAIWGPGRTAKVQCDFAALMSPRQFRRFVVPSLRRQCAALENSVYHLDGPDAIAHVDALMEIDELDALQWTCGAGQPDGASARWFPIYDATRRAGKALWIAVSDGGIDDWIAGAAGIVDRYGPDALYLHFPLMSEAEAERLLAMARRDWGYAG